MRRRTYKTPAAFDKAVMGYFSSISYEEPKSHAQQVGYTARGKAKFETVYETDKRGNPITETRYTRPPTVSGLCLYLGISRQCYYEYAAKEGYRDTAEFVRLKIDNYLEEETCTREKPQGVIAMIDYTARREENAKTAGIKTEMTMQERKEALQQFIDSYKGEEQ